MWLKTKDIQGNKQYPFILQLLSKEGHHLIAHENKDKETPDKA